MALLVYLLFAAPHLTTRCISVGVHLLTLLPDRVEAALLVRGHTLPTRPFYSTSYLPVRALEGDHVEDWVDALEQCIRPPSTAPGTWLGLRCCCCCTAQLHLLSFANGRLFKPSAETLAAQGAQRAQAPSQENWTKLGRLVQRVANAPWGPRLRTLIHSNHSSPMTPTSSHAGLLMTI